MFDWLRRCIRRYVRRKKPVEKPQCPKCGSIDLDCGHEEWLNVTIWFGNTKYLCKDCGHEFWDPPLKSLGDAEPRIERDVHRVPGTRSPVRISAPSLEQTIREEWLPTPKKPLRHRRPKGPYRPKTKAVPHDVGRFMRGSKHEHKWYRRTVKARVQPEED